MALRERLRSFAMYFPPVRRIILHRDELLRESAELRRRLLAAESAAESADELLRESIVLRRRSLAAESAARSAAESADEYLRESTELRRRLLAAESTLDELYKAKRFDKYIYDRPSRETAFRIFDGAWSSSVPGFGFGHNQLFKDDRINWLEKQCNGFKGKRVLELGPLEGGHTYMLSNAGVANVTSIEANTDAFLKCLIVQNALKFSADFILGDFRQYLDTCTETYDLLIAYGVLYHMSEPAKLLCDMARVSRAIGIWTHYYDSEVVLGRENLKRKFESEPYVQQVGSRDVLSYKHTYPDAIRSKQFCGGSAPTSYWLTRDSLLGILTDLGLTVVIGMDEKDHPNGPALLLFASR